MGLGDMSAWDEVIALDPQLGAALTDEQLDRALAAFADFSDLKIPLRLRSFPGRGRAGHSGHRDAGPPGLTRSSFAQGGAGARHWHDGNSQYRMGRAGSGEHFAARAGLDPSVSDRPDAGSHTDAGPGRALRGAAP